MAYGPTQPDQSAIRANADGAQVRKLGGRQGEGAGQNRSEAFLPDAFRQVRAQLLRDALGSLDQRVLILAFRSLVCQQPSH